jgi:hypothetical protein
VIGDADPGVANTNLINAIRRACYDDTMRRLAPSKEGHDMKTLVTTALITFLAWPALAFQCPADMAAIDAALETATLSEEDAAQVAKLREIGAAEHAAGNHQASVDALAQAKALLGM